MLRFSARYSAQIEGIFQKLAISSLPKPIPGSRGFVPGFHISFDILADQIIGDVVCNLTQPGGAPNGFSFDHDGKRIELSGEAWRETVRIAEAILRSPDFRETVSQETVLCLIFEWLKDKYTGVKVASPDKFLSEQCEGKIKDFEVWIPAAETFIEGELEFGRVIFKEISKIMIDRWEQNMIDRLAGSRPGMEEADLREYTTRFRRTYQGHAAATITVRAEPARAYEVAQLEANQSLALLRVLNFSNCLPSMTIYSLPMGQENVPGHNRFLVEDGIISFVSEGVGILKERDFTLDKEHVDRMRELGLERLHALLTKIQRNPFEEDVLSALLLYSRSSLQESPGDKLTYILAPLEFLLMDNSIDPQELGERLAMINDRSLQGRKAIVKNTREIYRLRSRFVRTEETQDDLEILRDFMLSAWTFFINVVVLTQHFKTRAEFTEHIEEWKLSGGLK